MRKKLFILSVALALAISGGVASAHANHDKHTGQTKQLHNISSSEAPEHNIPSQEKPTPPAQPATPPADTATAPTIAAAQPAAGSTSVAASSPASTQSIQQSPDMVVPAGGQDLGK